MEQIEHMREQIRCAAANARPLRIRGGATKDWYGQHLDGEALDVAGYSGIIDYAPTELVITARCGTPLAQLQAELASQGQMLACEPPSFGCASTVGGMIAAGLAGPARASRGAVRDALLGIRLLDGAARDLRFGGRVMKNVAGYDVARTLAGSMGTLGVILEASLKVVPCPAAECTLVFELDQQAALAQQQAWSVRPLPLSASCWHDGQLWLRLSGAHAAVAQARELLGGDVLDDADARLLWHTVRQQTHAFFDGDGPLWRLSLPAHRPALDGWAPQLIEWGGGQRWLRAGAGPYTGARLRAMAVAAGGHATLFRGPDKRAGVFQPQEPGVARISAAIKRVFDPANILNPRRMY